MKKLLISLICLCSAITVFAQSQESFKSQLSTKYPNLKVESVNYIQDIKLYELSLAGNPKPAYTNQNMDYFIIDGEIIDPKNKVNYSKDREFLAVKNFIKTFPLENAIKVKYGTGERQVYIFSDPDCPYCKALDKDIHTNLSKQNITFYYFLNPLPLPGHEGAKDKSLVILCSANPSSSWVDWMTKSILPNSSKTCPNSVSLEKTMTFSKTNGFNSTPIIFLDNGIVSNKQMSSSDIMTALNYRKP